MTAYCQVTDLSASKSSSLLSLTSQTEILNPPCASCVQQISGTKSQRKCFFILLFRFSAVI